LKAFPKKGGYSSTNDSKHSKIDRQERVCIISLTERERFPRVAGTCISQPPKNQEGEREKIYKKKKGGPPSKKGTYASPVMVLLRAPRKPGKKQIDQFSTAVPPTAPENWRDTVEKKCVLILENTFVGY